MLTWTLQLFKAEKASKPGTQDILIPWAVLLRTCTLTGADGIPAGRSQGQSVSWKPKHKPGTVAFPWSSQSSECDPTSEFCGCAGPPDREAQKCHFQNYFGHFYICDHSGQLKDHDLFQGTPSYVAGAAAIRNVSNFHCFLWKIPMEHRPGYEGRKGAMQPFRILL